MNCSDVTAAEVDQEVMAVLKEAYEEAKRLLTEHRKTLDKIAEFLIEKETITGKEFMKIFHEVEGIEEPEEKTPVSRISERVTEAPQAEEPTGRTETSEEGGSDKTEKPDVIEMPGPVAEQVQEAAGVTDVQDQPQEATVSEHSDEEEASEQHE